MGNQNQLSDNLFAFDTFKSDNKPNFCHIPPLKVMIFS